MRLNTQLISIRSPEAITIAQAIISRGGLVVFPTDTLYGLACDYRNLEAIQAVYRAKGRSTAKALPVLIATLDQLALLVRIPNPIAEKLMSKYWPGPLTLILPKLESLPEALTPYPGLAVRMPGHPFALELLSRTGPLAVTSANLSDQPNPLHAEGVLARLGGKIDLILDGGKLPPSPGSTIIDCTTSQPKLVRAGAITLEELNQTDH